MSEDLTVSPFYYSSVNEITKPESLTFTSHYFADRWMRELGPVGAAIVVILRSHCYHNRKRGELRDRVQLPVLQIAEEVGVSAKTVRRELDGNRALQRFVRVHVEYAPGRTPESVRRDANSYQVAMDDPVHPQDETRLQEVIREKARQMEKGAEDEEDAKARAKQKQKLAGGKGDGQKPCGQNDQAAPGGVDNLTRGRDNLAPGTPKLTRPSGQNDQTLRESFSVLQNPLESSPESSLTLFSEEEAPLNPPPLKDLPLRAWPRWVDLPEAEQRPYLDRAQQELVAIHAGSGIAPKPRLIEMRAQNLYLAAQKEAGLEED
jgi:hypothetical protein